jgi:hypothetical protein
LHVARQTKIIPAFKLQEGSVALARNYFFTITFQQHWLLINFKTKNMKNAINSGKILTREEMKNLVGGLGVFGTKCGTETCSKYQACCTSGGASGQTVYYCTTAACL